MLPGASLSRGPATLSVPPGGTVRAIQATAASTVSGTGASTSTGRPASVARRTVSAVPPVSGPRASTSVASASRTLRSVRTAGSADAVSRSG